MDLMFWFLMGGVVGFIMPFLLEATSDAFDSILEVLKWKFRKHQLVNLGAEGWFRAGVISKKLVRISGHSGRWGKPHQTKISEYLKNLVRTNFVETLNCGLIFWTK